MAEGKIKSDSAEKFTNFLIAKHISPYGIPPKPVLCFDSTGGDVVGAVKLGNKIREYGFDTCAEPFYNRSKLNERLQKGKPGFENAVCASACVFALAGGVSRNVGRGARIGVHQFSGVYWTVGGTHAQLSTEALAGYLKLMGVKSELLDIALACPHDQMHWLSAEEIRQLNIRNIER
ncbi:MAG: hypothetical protein ACLQVJ_10265 [Syntrophobacteraceae bacterium]